MTFLIPEKDNLVTYYMLPLTGLSKTFFYGCFGGSFIDNRGDKIYVKITKRPMTLAYKQNAYYVTEVKIAGQLYFIFRVPYHFLEDSKKFIEGRYSKMSKDAKKQIYLYSSLPYNKTMDSFKVSHPVLQALGRTKALRKYLADFLDVNENSMGELIDAPRDSWFIEHYYV